MIITLSFPADVSCSDRFCPANAYQTDHSHTLYNVYEIPERMYRDGIDELTVSEIATSIRPNEIAPVNSMKGALQNV